MELKSSKASPVLTDPAPVDKARLGIRGLLPCAQSGTSFSTSVLAIPRRKPGKLDDVRSNGWLDAMKSSSPPRKKIMKGINVEVVSDDGDIAYNSWMVCLSHIKHILVIKVWFASSYFSTFSFRSSIRQRLTTLGKS